jgi:hypothetical protein
MSEYSAAALATKAGLNSYYRVAPAQPLSSYVDPSVSPVFDSMEQAKQWRDSHGSASMRIGTGGFL